MIYNYFYPYVKIKYKDKKYDMLVMPFKQEDGYYICYQKLESDDGFIDNMNFFVNSLEIEEKTVVKIKRPCEIKILHYKEEVFNFNLHDDRHFGWTK